MRYKEYVVEYRHQFGDRLRAFRKEQRLTQEQFGLMTGLNRTYISRIENGRCSTSFDTITALANGLGISPSELLLGVADPENDPAPVPLTIPDRENATYHVTRS